MAVVKVGGGAMKAGIVSISMDVGRRSVTIS